ncbi:hypothetical protein HPP92_006048 [Vanilla planifolia]|uniref:Protein VTE6, chloroplastic n=1 Tax=Vanilla planifolia TaxID=51239 RepID=A0A835VBY3_VANPL|nr:hypothetical protein HPP92_006048 [Vanilla planifolia]
MAALALFPNLAQISRPLPSFHSSTVRFPVLFVGSKNRFLVPRTTCRVPSVLPLLGVLSPSDQSSFQAEFLQLVLASPATWNSAIASNLLIFTVGSPLLLSGLSVKGMASAFLLGVLTWRAFGAPGFLLVATYFIVGTAVTKLKIAQKEALGVAEKGKGRRGPGSVIGSSAAGCICALLSLSGVGGSAFAGIWQLGFVASFCTKLADTVSSEIGKAYGKTAYLVTTLKAVPRGTEGAVSVEGTIAGLLASVLLASVGYFLGEIDASQIAICVIASQIANLVESFIGAAFQEKKGFQWLSNDAVNVLNISIGSILAVLMQLLSAKIWLCCCSLDLASQLQGSD